MKDLVDFLEGRNKFAAAREYFGMASSQRDNVFAEYYANLSPADKREMAHIIVSGAVGRLEEVQHDLSSVVSLLLGLCIRDYSQFVRDDMGVLEEEFNNPENIASWVRATNDAPPARGLDFRKSWNYGLSLYNTLRRLNSEKVGETYEYLVNHAESEWFTSALQKARS